MQPFVCDVQRAAGSLQHASCDMQRTLSIMQRLHTGCNTLSMQHATYNVRCAASARGYCTCTALVPHGAIESLQEFDDSLNMQRLANSLSALATLYVPQPHLRRDWAHPIPTSAPRLGPFGALTFPFLSDRLPFAGYGS